MSGLRALLDPRLAGAAGMAGRFMHRCAISRGIPATHDDPATAAPHLVDQDCYYWETVSDEQTDETGRQLLRVAHLIVPLGTDVAADDRLTSVVDHLGVERLSHPLSIDGDPIRHQTHLELLLRGLS